MSNEVVDVYRDYIRNRVQVSIRNDEEIRALDNLKDPITSEILIGELINVVLDEKTDAFVIENDDAVGIVTEEVKEKLRIPVVNN